MEVARRSRCSIIQATCAVNLWLNSNRPTAFVQQQRDIDYCLARVASFPLSTEGKTDGRVNGRLNGRLNGRMDGREKRNQWRKQGRGTSSNWKGQQRNKVVISCLLKPPTKRRSPTGSKHRFLPAASTSLAFPTPTPQMRPIGCLTLDVGLHRYRPTNLPSPAQVTDNPSANFL